jgi:hypothetical protein
MNLIKRMPRGRKFQGIVAAAVIAGSAAIAVPAVAATGSPAAPASTPPACATSQLQVWLGIPGDAAAGHVAYQLEFSNISARACSLLGFPGVSAVKAGGGQLGSAAGRDSGDPKKLVTLARGATAHAFLIATNTAFLPPSSCHPTTAIGLKVFPPNTAQAQIVDFPIGACAKAGPVFLRVRTVVAGTGIPGFSS